MMFKFKLWVIFFCLLVFPFSVSARSYDFYVDESVSESGNGSEDEPFKTISEALNAAEDDGGSQDIFIERGIYNESIEMGKKIKLYGESESDVGITGKVGMDDGSELHSVTVSGKYGFIRIREGADVLIDNCTVTDFDDTGIDVEAGSGTLMVRNSKITNGGGKGLYIQRGKSIEITGCYISGNSEEGLDIRSKVTGNIKNNTIIENGESALEVVVGEADLNISDNDLSKNGSSGIAMQYYVDFNQLGDITISNNDIESNKKFGIDCNSPLSKIFSPTYWKKSAVLSKNTVKGNSEAAISPICQLQEKVEASNIIEQVTPNNSKSEEDQADLFEESEETELTLEQIQARVDAKSQEIENKEKRSQLEDIIEENQSIEMEIEEEINNLKKKNIFVRFFVGSDKNKINSLIFKVDKRSHLFLKSLLTLSDVFPENEGSTEDKLIFQNQILKLEASIGIQKDYLYKEKKAFSVLGWLKEII